LTSILVTAWGSRKVQVKLEAQYAAKREAHFSEVTDLKQQLELKGNEVRSLGASIDSLKGVNEELKVRFESAAAISSSRSHRVSCSSVPSL